MSKLKYSILSYLTPISIAPHIIEYRQRVDMINKHYEEELKRIDNMPLELILIELENGWNKNKKINESL